MSYRTEVTIPVKRDPRTFEQRHKDLVTNLEKSYTSSVSSAAGDTTTASAIKSETRGTSGDVGWDRQRSKWIDGAKKRFDMDMAKMRNDMFALEPMDEFDLDNWDNFGNLTHFGNDGDSSFERMERRMEAMRQQMESSMRMGGMQPMGSIGGPQMGSSNVTSHFSSSSTRTVNDGGLVTKSSNTSQESRQTVNGVSTGTKSTSSSTTTNKIGSGNAITMSSETPGTLVPTSPSAPIGGVMDFLSNAFEVGDDGLVHFKVRFDAKEFRPEDIDVTTVGNRLTVHAKTTIKTNESSSNRDFSRTIDLPQSIDHEKFSCALTNDGVLILDAPVNAPDYSSITFDEGHNLGIRPKDSTALSSSNTKLAIKGQSGPVVLNDGAGGRKLHLEVPVESSFTSDDICVRMEANKIIVSGKKESSADKSMDSSNSKSSFTSSASQQFTRTFEVPETIDPFTVSAVLKNGTLVIEAPLLCTV